MTSLWGQVSIARRRSGEQRLDDAHQQRLTIMGDEDAEWLKETIGFIGNADISIAVPRRLRISFLPEGNEAVLSHLSESGELITIEMPEGSVVSLLRGHDFDTWVYRLRCSDEHIDVAYRALETGDYLLYLYRHVRGGAVIAH